MSSIKRIVCLANSRKLGGRCVAGKVIADHQISGWLRPVSALPTGELSSRQCQYENGDDPQPLDVIDVPLACPVPHAFQTENWEVASNERWVKIGRLKWQCLRKGADSPRSLWINNSSTRHGCHDRVTSQDAGSLDCSLYLIPVPRLSLTVISPSVDFGDPERRVQAAFRYRGTNYALWVTDPIVEAQLIKPKGPNKEDIGECYLTISLGEEFLGFHYKLVAAIIRTS